MPQPFDAIASTAFINVRLEKTEVGKAETRRPTLLDLTCEAMTLEETMAKPTQESQHFETMTTDEKKMEGGTPETVWTMEEEKKALRKLDWCLIPL